MGRKQKKRPNLEKEYLEKSILEAEFSDLMSYWTEFLDSHVVKVPDGWIGTIANILASHRIAPDENELPRALPILSGSRRRYDDPFAYLNNIDESLEYKANLLEGATLLGYEIIEAKELATLYGGSVTSFECWQFILTCDLKKFWTSKRKSAEDFRSGDYAITENQLSHWLSSSDEKKERK